MGGLCVSKDSGSVMLCSHTLIHVSSAMAQAQLDVIVVVVVVVMLIFPLW